MENSRDSSSLTSELQQGEEIARQLQILLNEPDSTNSQEIRGFLVQQIIESFSRAVFLAQQAPSPLAMARSGSPLSSEDPDPIGEESTTRKVLPRWKTKVQVRHETGFEGPPGDGYNWRKYGQKDILEAAYPRSYYRCSLSQQTSCPAKKQVQRTDEDPTIFEVSYRGLHTCKHQVSNPKLPSSSSSHPQDQPPPQPPTQPPGETLITFETTNAYQPQTIDFNNHHQLPSSTNPFSFHGSSSATTTATSSTTTTSVGATSDASPTDLPIDHNLPFDGFDFDESEFFS